MKCIDHLNARQKPVLPSALRQHYHGSIQPMRYEKRSLLQRLFGGAA